MSKRYPGNFITGNPVALSQSSNNGIFDLKDQYQAISNGTWQGADGIQEVSKSIRFRNSGWLSRVPSTSGNRNRWTWSAWTKWTGVSPQLFGVTSGIGQTSTQEDNRLAIQLANDGQFQFYEFTSATFAARKYSTGRFRDPGAWYHLIVAVDYTETIADNRIKMYVNGVQLAAFDATTTPSLNLTSYMNGYGNNHTIGGQIKTYNNFYDGYMTEIYLIDGQQLDASYFGYTDTISGIWQPKKYTGPYGTNGFYLPMTDSADTYTADVLVVAGGGGGNGGGGGGGGVLAPTAQNFVPGRTYTITVGGGGVAQGRGNDSSIVGTGNTLLALGGGQGYAAGGSGGGSWEPNSVGGLGTTGMGTKGGNAGGVVGDYGCGGGGGGGSSQGGNGSGTTPGAGGTGYLWNGTYYAGGGGGGSPDGRYPRTTSGGAGGGGTSYYSSADAGSPNTGGGGGSAYPPLGIYGAGGNGVVILRIPTANYTGTVTGGPTVTTDGSFKMVKFTGSGSYTA